MKVVTSVVNNPIFIQIQYYTLKKYMKCDYEFIVFNDAKPFPDFSNGNDPTLRAKIEETCKTLGITCIPVNNPTHVSVLGAADRCADTMNIMLRYQLEHPDEYLIIDSDMFLITDFDPSIYRDYHSAVLLQERDPSIVYIWNGIVYFNIPKVPRPELLKWNLAPRCDVGGSMQPWLRSCVREFPTTKQLRYEPGEFHRDSVYFIKHLWSGTWDESEYPSQLRHIAGLVEFMKRDPRNKNGKFFCEIYDNRFLHYRAGGNWMNQNMSLHNSLAQELKTILLDGSLKC